MSGNIRQLFKASARKIAPLAARKRFCILLNRQRWIREASRSWWTSEMLSDFRSRDINGYHKFLWANHLGYALPYETSARFGREKIAESRRIFFSDLIGYLNSIGIDPQTDIHSILEVGCSLGYQLRYLETDVAHSARELVGIDIDAYAISQGKRILGKMGSKVELICGEMTDLDALLGTRSFDLIFSTGVLMYLGENEAAKVAEAMLKRARVFIALSGPAHSETDNRFLSSSVARTGDNAFVHNIDAMVTKAGAEIVGRRWEGKRIVEGHTLYSVFARPADACH